MFAFGEHVETVTAGPGIPQVGRRLVTAILGGRAVDAGEPSQQVFRVRPHRHPVDLEPSADRDHALATRTGSSDSVYLALRQGGSSSSPRVRHGLGLGLGGFLRLIVDTEFRLFPRGTEPLEPLPGVRFESIRVHPTHDPRTSFGSHHTLDRAISWIGWAGVATRTLSNAAAFADPPNALHRPVTRRSWWMDEAVPVPNATDQKECEAGSDSSLTVDRILGIYTQYYVRCHDPSRSP